MGGPERVGAAPGVERQVHGHPKASCIAWQPEGGRYTAAWSRRATVVRQEAGRRGREREGQKRFVFSSIARIPVAIRTGRCTATLKWLMTSVSHLTANGKKDDVAQ